MIVAFGFDFEVEGDFTLGFAVAVDAFVVDVDLVVVAAFFLGLLVVLPVCAFGRDAGFVAYERRAMLIIIPLTIRPDPLENADAV